MLTFSSSTWIPRKDDFYKSFFLAAILASGIFLLGSENPGRFLQRFFSDQILSNIYLGFTSPPSKGSQEVFLITIEPTEAGRVDRDHLAQTIDKCYEAEPKAIGVDVLLEGEMSGNDALAKSLKKGDKYKKLVLATHFERSLRLPKDFQGIELTTGVANFPNTTEDQTVRQVLLWCDSSRQKGCDKELTQELSQDSKKISFGAAIMKTAGFSKDINQLSKDNHPLRLKYMNVKPTKKDLENKKMYPYFSHLDAKEIRASGPKKEVISLKDKIVLIGDTSPTSKYGDCFLTPVGWLRGIYLHAITIDTLLQQNSPLTLQERLGLQGLYTMGIIPLLLFPFLAIDTIFRQCSGHMTLIWLVLIFLVFLSVGYLAFSQLNLILPISSLLFGTTFLALKQVFRLRKDLDTKMKQLALDNAEYNERLKKIGLFEPVRDLELALRGLTAKLFAEKYGEDWESSLIKEYQDNNPKGAADMLRMRDNARSQAPDSTITILNTLTLEDWQQLIQSHWGLFGKVFGGKEDKKRLLEWLREIRDVRNLVFHHNQVGKEKIKLVEGYLENILKPIEVYTTKSA